MTSNRLPRFSPTRMIVTRLASSSTENRTRYMLNSRNSLSATGLGRNVFRFFVVANGSCSRYSSAFFSSFRPVFLPSHRKCATAASFTSTVQAMFMDNTTDQKNGQANSLPRAQSFSARHRLNNRTTRAFGSNHAQAVWKEQPAMNVIRMLSMGVILGTWLLSEPAGRGQEKKPVEIDEKKLAKEVAAAREKGLDWLTKNQNADGSWGKSYTIGITSMGCLAYLSAADEPFTGARGKALVKGLQFLMTIQKDGMFLTQGQSVRTWIHGQGFATLALAEAYGRSLFCKVKPDIDTKKIRAVVAQSIKEIAKNQSTSGGWWYTPGELNRDEGATTVCAVQALVSAENYGIDIDKKVLDHG